MKSYKVKTKVAVDFNDSQNNGKHYEFGDEIILERARYEELLAKGKVEKGTIIEENKTENKIENKVEPRKTFKKEEE